MKRYEFPIFVLVAIVLSVFVIVVGNKYENRRQDRIRQQGITAGKLGLHPSFNPHGPLYSELWIDGYLEGLQMRDKTVTPDDVLKMVD